VRLHEGEPGSKKHLLATPDGVCKRFLRSACDRGENCRFLHETVKPPIKRVTTDTPRMFAMLKGADYYEEPEAASPSKE
jgi:hypothetical protein